MASVKSAALDSISVLFDGTDKLDILCPEDLSAAPSADTSAEDLPKDNHFLKIAEGCILRGEFRILPIKKGAKSPLIKWKGTSIDTASTAEWLKLSNAHLQEMGRRFPDANACVLAKPNEKLFLDIDTMTEFHEAYEKFAGEPYPKTHTTSARENRCQEHFLQTDEARTLRNIGQFEIDGIDFSVRYCNSYVIAEGSTHPKGSTYKTIVDAAIAPMPDKLVAFIKHLCKKAGKESESFSSSQNQNPSLAFNEATDELLDAIAASFIKREAPNGVAFGQHDCFLISLAGALRREGAGQEQIEKILVRDCEEICIGHRGDFAEMCHNKAVSACRYPVGQEPPFTVGGKKASKDIASIVRPKSQDQPLDQSVEDQNNYTEFEIVRADSVEMKSVKWLWKGRFAEKMNTINGDPGEGKGVLISYIVARITKGEDFYDAKNDLPPSEVLVLSNEDNIEDTLVPRFVAAGADLSKILIVKMMRYGKNKEYTREFCLGQDLENVRNKVLANPLIKLMVVDPVSNYLPPNVKTIDEKSVRLALMPVVRLAEDLGITIIGVQHLNKKADQKFLYRVSGAMGFIGVGRMNWLCSKVPPAKDGTLNEDYEMQKVKGNLVKRNQAGLIYRIEDAIVKIQGKDTVIPYLKFVGSAATTLDQQAPGESGKKSAAINLNTRTSECEDELVKMLTPGPMPADEVVHYMGVDFNIGKTIVYRAAANLKVVKFKSDKTETGKDGKQYHVGLWRLPDRPEKDTLNQGEELAF